jgi:quercetin dioxygenase-like cupin family protein
MRTRALVVLCVLLAFAGGLAVGRARGQAKPRMWADVLLDTTTDQLPPRARVHVNVDHWDPGAETGKHTHPGPTVIVVLEGELQEQTQGHTNALTAGHAYWRPARHEHNVRNVSGHPVRALAVHIDPATR